MTFERTSQQGFLGTSAVLFATSASLTALWCRSMSVMGHMAMPGGWTMSMAWMPVSGQTWLEAAACFVGMWVVMMVAMMLPSLAPTLWRYRRMIAATGDVHGNRLAALAGIGYFLVWTVFGVVVFPVGATLAAVEMRQPGLARIVPLTAGVIVVIAGALQFSPWKARHLACCRNPWGGKRCLPAGAATAWRNGVRLGLHCVFGCAGFTAILLVVGVMDLRVMGLVTMGITAERLAPNGARVARAVGCVAVGVGLLLIAKAGLG